MRKACLCLLLFFLLCCSGCVTFIGYDGPYEGRVLDRDTLQPIEGAVVHATWDRSSPGPGGASGRYYDSQETLTDKKGNFKIKGVGLLFLSNIEEPIINIFKAGYTQENSYWSGFTLTTSKGVKYHPEIESDNGSLIFKLRRMTLEERKSRHPDMSGGVPTKKMRLMIKERNKEKRELGYPSQYLLHEE